MNASLKVQPQHLERGAYLYVRQSSMRQVVENGESTKRQYALRGRATALQVNTFFMSEQDSLNELSPAEVLAGLPFEDLGTLAPAQSRMLSLLQGARMDKVMTLARLEVVADRD
jgi:hypothetical protein